MSGPLLAHVGIAVADLDKSIELYKLITGDSNPHMESILERGLKLAMFGEKNPDSGARVELLGSTSPESTIAKFISRHGEGLHHICIYVDDIVAKLAQFKAAGFQLIDELPRVGAGGMKIAFVHPSNTGGVLLELQERLPG
ncbi:MAG TPA: methylmalonyl-CoA epimerase [Candidatus Acidoferrum sp.]|nr:methylmalonyl-CoA epimerase [Candidatus Acidoferrum sp.]